MLRSKKLETMGNVKIRHTFIVTYVSKFHCSGHPCVRVCAHVTIQELLTDFNETVKPLQFWLKSNLRYTLLGDLYVCNQYTSPLYTGLPIIPHRNYLVYIYSFNVVLHLTIAMKIQSPIYTFVFMNTLCVPATMLQYTVDLFLGYRERFGMCCIRNWKAIFKIFAFNSTCLKQSENCKHARTPTLYIRFSNLLIQY